MSRLPWWRVRSAPRKPVREVTICGLTVRGLTSCGWTVRRDSRRRSWQVDPLESRLLLTSYTPAQISQAYGFNQIQFGNVKGDGSGQTIAIVDAYDAPNVSSDLATFDAAYGLPNNDSTGAFALTKATPAGVPAYDEGWAQEITLDVEWAHAIAPGAHILLVEAASSNFSDLLAAVDYARNQPGVSVVSMSWGGTEFSGENLNDSYFTTPAGHAGVSFVASAGDTGAVQEYPAVSPNVLSVGGTTLTTLDSSGTYGSETTWTSSGGGISVYESKPPFQSSVTQSSTQRTTPDVSYDANPNTGVSVYFTDSTGAGSWYTFGGTSIGAPQWAALVAIADQGRALNGQGPLDGPTQLLPAIYNMPSSDFHDITQGTAGTRRHRLSAGNGYDLVTGRGSPYANLVVRDLVNATANGAIGSPTSYVGAVSISAQTGSLTYGTAGSATYTVTVNRGTGTGAFDAGLAVTTGLPPGATYVFTVGGTVTNTLHFGASDNALTATLTITSAVHTPAGSSPFTVTAEQLDTSGNPTGDQSTAGGTLAINQRVLTVTATAQNKVYDGTTAATVTLQDDRVAGDSFTINDASATFSDKNAGTGKTVTVAGITLSGADAANYTLNPTVTTTAAITPRAITITADAETKAFGSADPPLTWQLTTGALVGGDSLSGALTRAAGEGVGTYAIMQGTLTAGTNYDVTFVGSTLTIGPGYDLSGPWTIGGQLTSVTQNGLGLTFIDQNGVSSTGNFSTVNQITGRNGLTATIDTSTVDDGRIVWSDGTIWLRVSLGGQYYNPANNGLTAIIQNGTQLTFVNVAGGATTGSLLGPNQVSLPGWGQTGAWVDGTLSFSAGSAWKKLDLSSDYQNLTGDALHILQNGTVLTFVNKAGGTSAGSWLSPTQVQATGWNVTGTVINGQILWSNGSVWNKDLVVSATSSGTGTTSIAATSTQILLTNTSGGTSRAQVTGANTLVALDWSGLIGTRSNGRILWSDGTVWDNFDFNALDAVFSDIRTLPFGS